MAKPALTAPKAEKAEASAKKPSIKFCPKMRQYENGIDFMQANGVKVKIKLDGYVAPTMEDERRLLRLMERDPFCGLTTWENREIPQAQKDVEAENRKLRAERDYQDTEMEALREENRRLKEAQKA